ncbi:MAG: 1-acyl-sn-glycerol-3-phosphate acyltransferase [Myxococcales bacterium]|nr:1-acyl-sn-glycerol-3-phosphate acyltransferase [Myxococcales bacterium]
MLATRATKRLLFGTLGIYDWVRFTVFNSLRAEGHEHLRGLPPRGVLFVSNHLTYYIDVLAIHQAIVGPRCAMLDGFRANLDLRFVAAAETLNDRGWAPKIFNYTGAVLVRRTWREAGQDIQRPVQAEDIVRIGDALRRGWLLTFPQGTTTPGAPVRKGTAHIIREHRPVVVPVHLEGLDRAFDRKGLRRIASGVDLLVRFGAPLAITGDESVEEIVEALTWAIAPEASGSSPPEPKPPLPTS